MGSLRDTLFPGYGTGCWLDPCVRVISLTVQMKKLRLKERAGLGVQGLTTRKTKLEF